MPNQPASTTTTSTIDQASNAGAPRYEELFNLVSGLQDDFEKFYLAGNKAAGTRVRAAMLILKDFAQRVRAEVSAIKNSER